MAGLDKETYAGNKATVHAAVKTHVAAALAGVAAGDDPAARGMAQLQVDHRDLLQQRKANAQAIKNEVKKNKRLKDKAKNLSTADLQDILIQRAAAAAKPKAKPKAKAKAAAVPAGHDD